MKIWQIALSVLGLLAMTSLASADSALMHTSGNAEVAVTDFGALGSIRDDGIAPNFKFPKSGNTYYLHQLSEIWIGDANGNVASAWGLNAANQLASANWATTTDGAIDKSVETDGRQIITAQYESSRLPDFPLNILVDQQSFSWATENNPDADDFIVIKLIVTNNSLIDLNGIYVAIMANWDVDGSDVSTGQLSLDWVDWDEERGTLFTYDGDDTDGTNAVHVGLTLLDGKLATHQIFTFFNFNRQPDGRLFQDVVRSRLMSDPTIAFNARQDLTNPWDYVSILSAGPYDISAKDSVVVTFALVAGENLADLQKNIDEAWRISYAPQRLMAEVVRGAVTLRWEKSINPSVSGYMILRRIQGQSEFQPIGPRIFDGITFDDTTIENGIEYIYKIRPVDFNEEPLEFDSQEIRARPDLIPDSPENLRVALGENQIVLNWTKSTQQVDGYVIYRNHTGHEPWTQIATVPPTSTGFIDINVYPGLTYFYTITAANQSGTQGDFSTTVNISLPEEPSIVAEPNLDNVIVVPNPYRLSVNAGPIEFRNLTRRATIHIYSSAGDLIKIIDHRNNKPIVPWNGQTEDEHLISPGVYIYYVETLRENGRGRISTMGKFAVIR